jgi:hypothetical protein
MTTACGNYGSCCPPSPACCPPPPPPPSSAFQAAASGNTALFAALPTLLTFDYPLAPNAAYTPASSTFLAPAGGGVFSFTAVVSWTTASATGGSLTLSLVSDSAKRLSATSTLSAAGTTSCVLTGLLTLAPGASVVVSAVASVAATVNGAVPTPAAAALSWFAGGVRV